MTATTGEHFHPPSQAQASVNTVISSMKKRAREESVPLPQIYCHEMTKLYGAPGCDETAVNVPSFQTSILHPPTDGSGILTREGENTLL